MKITFALGCILAVAASEHPLHGLQNKVNNIASKVKVPTNKVNLKGPVNNIANDKLIHSVDKIAEKAEKASGKVRNVIENLQD